MIVKQLDHPAGKVYKTVDDCIRAVERLFPWLPVSKRITLVMINQDTTRRTVITRRHYLGISDRCNRADNIRAAVRRKRAAT